MRVRIKAIFLLLLALDSFAFSFREKATRSLVEIESFQLVRSPSGRRIYRMEGGSIHPFPNLDVFVALGYDFDIDKVIVVTDEELAKLPKGESLTTESARNPKLAPQPNHSPEASIVKEKCDELEGLDNTTHHVGMINHPKIKGFLCALRQPLDPIVDAKLHDLHRVYHTGNLCPFHRKIGEKFKRGENIVIEVLGGSETWGVDLVHRDLEKWTTILDHYLNSGWYPGKFQVINRGIRACGIEAWIWQTTRFVNADLVIVDASVNDQTLDMQSLPHHYKFLIERMAELPNSPALMFLQLFRLTPDNSTKSEVFQQCPQTYGHCCGNGVLYCPQWWDMHDFVTGTLKKYSVPFLSYRDLVWPDYNNPPSNLLSFWNGMSHPDYKVHALIGKLAGYGIIRQLQESLKFTSSCAAGTDFAAKYIVGNDIEDKELKSICSNPLSKMMSDSKQDEQRFALNMPTSPRWRYIDDVPSKFGWLFYESMSNVTELCPLSKQRRLRQQRRQRRRLHSQASISETEVETYHNNDPTNTADRSNSSTVSYHRLLENSMVTPKLSSICPQFVEASTMSFNVEFSTTLPILQLTYLKSWSEDMGKVVVWLDDKIDETVLVSGYWTNEYSVSHLITLTASPMLNVSSLLLGESAVLRSISPGKHVLHIAPAEFISAKSKNLKWKLIGITAC